MRMLTSGCRSRNPEMIPTICAAKGKLLENVTVPCSFPLSVPTSERSPRNVSNV